MSKNCQKKFKKLSQIFFFFLKIAIGNFFEKNVKFLAIF